MTRNQMLKQITTAYNIMNLKSSTWIGMKEILTGVDKRLAELDINHEITWSYNDSSQSMKDKFWEIHNRLQELRNAFDSNQVQKDIAIMFSRNDKRHNAEWFMNRLNNIYDKNIKKSKKLNVKI